MTQPLSHDAEGASLALFDELQRIVAGIDREQFMIFLPLVNDADALAFLTTVPTGVTLEELHRLATDYRAAHPAVDMDDDDR